MPFILIVKRELAPLQRVGAVPEFIAAKDRTINPDLERWYTTRADSHKVEVAGAIHAVYVSRPKEVAARSKKLQRTLGRRPFNSGRTSFIPAARRCRVVPS